MDLKIRCDYVYSYILTGWPPGGRQNKIRHIVFKIFLLLCTKPNESKSTIFRLIYQKRHSKFFLSVIELFNIEWDTHAHWENRSQERLCFLVLDTNATRILLLHFSEITKKNKSQAKTCYVTLLQVELLRRRRRWSNKTRESCFRILYFPRYASKILNLISAYVSFEREWKKRKQNMYSKRLFTVLSRYIPLLRARRWNTGTHTHPFRYPNTHIHRQVLARKILTQFHVIPSPNNYP